jgi:hypothetical protein
MGKDKKNYVYDLAPLCKETGYTAQVPGGNSYSFNGERQAKQTGTHMRSFPIYTDLFSVWQLSTSMLTQGLHFLLKDWPCSPVHRSKSIV